MKTTGIVRNIDELGRVVIPKEIRRNLGISNNDPIEFFVDSDRIILQKFQSCCHFCGGSDKVIDLNLDGVFDGADMVILQMLILGIGIA